MNLMPIAMVFTNEEIPFKKQQIPLNDLNHYEVLVRIVYTTICTSDLHTYTGRRNSPCPSVLGHEIVGEIIATGKKIRTDYNGHLLKTGDLVTWCVYAYDNKSKMAKRGIPQKSENLYKYGHQKFTVEDGLNGGFATHCVLKKGTAIFKLPKNLNIKEAAPLNCTHATIAGALRTAGYMENKTVLITGAGMLGLSACAMVTEGGAKSVTVMDIDTERMKFAKKFGANKMIDGKLSLSEIKLHLNNDSFDIVIDTTGVTNVMENGLELLDIGGTAVWIGAVYKQEPVKVNAEMIVRKLLKIKGLHNYTPDDLGFAVDFVAKNRLKYPFDLLIGTEFILDEVDLAFETANTGSFYRVGIVSNI